MTRLVTLNELLGPTGHDNGATPLFDADSLEVEAGPTPQQVVIHGGKNASGIRRRVAELDPRHPEVSVPLPRDAKEKGSVNEEYSLPSAQVLASVGVSDAKGRPAGHPTGTTLVQPDRPRASGSPSEPVDAAFEAQDPQPDGEVLQPHQVGKPGGSGSQAKRRARAKTPARSKVVQEGREQSTTASTQRSPRPAAGSSDRPAAGDREQEKT